MACTLPSVRPAVLVQSFVDVIGEENGVPLAPGITDDPVVALSRFRWFAVARQGTDAAYVLSGNVRKSGFTSAWNPASVPLPAQKVHAPTP